jgi:hypothetical protein
MKGLLATILATLSLSLTAQTEEQQKEQHRADKFNQPQVHIYEPVSLRPNALYAVPVTSYRPVYFPGSGPAVTSSLEGSIGLSLGGPTAELPVTFGAYLTLGHRHRLYLHARSSPSNPYNHYPEISLYQVNQWQDKLAETFTHKTDIGLGITIQQNQTLNHLVGLNLSYLDMDLVYLDEDRILPYPLDQHYSIEGKTETKVSLMYGLNCTVTGRLEVGLHCLASRQPTMQVNLGLKL